MTDILELSITEAGDKARAGEIGFVDLVKACLAREEATQDLNAFSDLYADEALALAEAHQGLLKNGCDLGPLHGIPVALKANIAIRNHRMTAGSAILADHIATEDADVTQRLKRAGAIIVGATNMHEFAWGGTTANPHFGQCRNPWDRNRIPAGSSGGSGAAVAARSAYATLGTDTGGSVRLPASMNGVTGLRPGVGRISTKGVFPLAWSMDTVGPLAPSARDCASLFSILSGSNDDLKDLGRSLAGLRIGVIDPYSFQSLQPDVDAAFRSAIALFEEIGVVFQPIAIDGLDVAVDAQVIVDAAEPSAVHADWIEKRPQDYGEDVRILLQAGKSFTAIEYLQAQRYRTYLREQFDAVFGEIDMVLTPTLPFTAPLIGQETIMIGDKEESTLTGNMRFTCIPSLTALPAISFPIGLDSLSLPIGAQLLAGEDKELLLLRTVHKFQGNSMFHFVKPL